MLCGVSVAAVSFAAAAHAQAGAIPYAFIPQTLVGAQCGTTSGVPTGGKTYYVSHNGNDANNGLSQATAFKTIGNAFLKWILRPGDVLLVGPGTYAESIYMRIPGAPGACITLMGMPGQARPVLSWRDDHSATLNVWAPYVRVSGLAVTHPEPHLNPKSRSNSSNSAIDVHSQYVSDADGVLRPTVHHVQIDNDVTYGAGCGGISFEGTDYVLAYGNTSYGNAYSESGHCSGINIYEPMNLDSAPGYHNYILNNYTYGNTNLYPVPGKQYTTDENGIIIDDSRQLQAIARSPGVNFTAYTGATLILGNVIFGNGGHGVEIYSSDNVDIFNNVAYQDLNDPEYQGYPSNTGGELDVEYSGHIRIENNIAVAPSSGQQVLSQYGKEPDQASNLWAYNISDVGFISLGAANPGNAAGKTGHGVNPHFVAPSTDPANAETGFKLDPGSRARSAGTEIGLRLTDIFGWTVPATGRKMNIGASLQ
jgi:serralysin